ncbi:DivIVA domain-containing protein [Streptomyces hygroscopicus]|nr:DivIVA domain-containing protein [Streptomyces hygroscopicus]
MTVFLFLLIALVVVVGGVTLAVVGGGDGPLPEAPPDRLDAPLPADRPLARTDVEALRLPMTLRGYRMADVDDVLGRLGAELAERDARIAELEAALAGAPPKPLSPPSGSGSDPLPGPEAGEHGFDRGGAEARPGHEGRGLEGKGFEGNGFEGRGYEGHGA